MPCGQGSNGLFPAPIPQLIGWFVAQKPTGTLAQRLEIMVRAVFFESANALVGYVLQWAADCIDEGYQPKPGEERQVRVACQVQGLFGCFDLVRDYYYDAGRKQEHHAADDALGLEGGYTPGLARIVCLEGADENSSEGQIALGRDRRDWGVRRLLRNS